MGAIKAMRATNFEYTHFAGLFQPVQSRTREAYCDACGAETVMPADTCRICGAELADVFRLQAFGNGQASNGAGA
jgi:ribosomal protein L40E